MTGLCLVCFQKQVLPGAWAEHILSDAAVRAAELLCFFRASTLSGQRKPCDARFSGTESAY